MKWRNQCKDSLYIFELQSKANLKYNLIAIFDISND